MQIIPTILEKEFSKAEERLLGLTGMSTWVQIDTTDNVFTTGKSFELELVNDFVGNEKYLWDMHLMVKEPIDWVEKCMFIGASRIVGQVEMMTNRDGNVGMQIMLVSDVFGDSFFWAKRIGGKVKEIFIELEDKLEKKW